MKYLILILGLLIVIACSTSKDPLPNSSHPEGWASVSSAEFHGTKVMESGLYTCVSCHGEDFKGGESGASCYTCHSTYPHSQAWTDLGATEGTHKIYTAQYGTTVCQDCHGSDYNGGRLGTDHACVQCHTSAEVSSW